MQSAEKNMEWLNMSNKLYVSMYHYTRNIAKSRYPGIKGMSDVQFRA